MARRQILGFLQNVISLRTDLALCAKSAANARVRHGVQTQAPEACRRGGLQIDPAGASALGMIRHDLHRDQILDVDQAERCALGIDHRKFVDPKFSNQSHGIPYQILM